MKILITGLAAILLAGVVYYLVTSRPDDVSEQIIVSTPYSQNNDIGSLAEKTQVTHAVFNQPSSASPQYSAATSIMDEIRATLSGAPRTRLLVLDKQLVAELFAASDAIVKGEFGLGKRFDVTLFDDQPCSFDALLHPMTRAGTFWVLQAKCQERSHKNNVRMILSPQSNQLYVSISDRGKPQTKSVHLTGDYVMALDEPVNVLEKTGF